MFRILYVCVRASGRANLVIRNCYIVVLCKTKSITQTSPDFILILSHHNNWMPSEYAGKIISKYLWLKTSNIICNICDADQFSFWRCVWKWPLSNNSIVAVWTGSFFQCTNFLGFDTVARFIPETHQVFFSFNIHSLKWEQ